MSSKIKKEYKITFKKFIGHLHTVNKHRFLVFLLCTRVGLIWRGLTHDLSKYSPTEFFEGVRYFTGYASPIRTCRKVNGYSKAWLHHKGRNKHHYEYWVDYDKEEIYPVIPYKYVAEMICDSLAAGITYQKKKWTKSYQLDYWMKIRKYAKINPKIDFLLTKVYTEIREEGIKKVITSKNLKELYKIYVG